MRWALLLYANVEAAKATTREEAERELARYGRITQELADEGVLRGGEAFLPASFARRVMLDSGDVADVAVPDGPLELSGYYLVECDQDRAMEIATIMPVAAHGQVEVRPLMDVPTPG